VKTAKHKIEQLPGSSAFKAHARQVAIEASNTADKEELLKARYSVEAFELLVARISWCVSCSNGFVGA
jgi:hypothetical protein